MSVIGHAGGKFTGELEALWPTIALYWLRVRNYFRKILATN